MCVSLLVHKNLSQRDALAIARRLGWKVEDVWRKGEDVWRKGEVRVTTPDGRRWTMSAGRRDVVQRFAAVLRRGVAQRELVR
jgi:predicted DNA-binding transcriptional regulator